MEAKKLAEGEEHMRLGEKALKTSLTKWSPDLDTAADEFSRAGTCFKVAKAYDRALDAFSRSCDCNKNCRQLYQAAKALETSILICKDANKTDLISNLAERGGLLYRQHGSPESAAQLMEKAAKILESSRPQEALALYQKAADTILTEDRPKQAADILGKVSQLQAKEKLWTDTANTLEQTIKLMQESGSVGVAGKYVSALVLVHLVAEDVVAASKSLAVWGGYCDSDQSQALHKIIDGFGEEDGEMVKQGLNSPAMKNLDVEFTKMVKDIKIPEGTGGDLEAAAAAFGAQRAAVIAAAEEPSKGTNETNFGVDPLEPEELGKTVGQREEELKNEEEEDEDELC
ncbi:hypothetical protein TCAL_01972 [Tigriopus californicus]|uniref:Gamma-soluble NSF attachment protein n=1 Tax=Tigriopus californicus TaxID=6832 RepID=A0A553PNI2_TIGCA|nr:gamma-soluble NSF attachment protein-like [Tigriopus californicus]TRY79242.1 hypothetical protein TCAL_01972 [Tigriopus californicus]|eukprot:TCALIF_01972-PA protein Name:"Similar to Napg Gamma-soluble NSF attachment protein (Mus musculus)" AED:0.00 eAED:0.00 QI:0/-1/0/1/-1/1/1/0/343